MFMAKSRIQIEREQRKIDFMDDYQELMKDGNCTQLEVFAILAKRYGYSDFNTARTTYHRWKKSMNQRVKEVNNNLK